MYLCSWQLTNQFFHGGRQTDAMEVFHQFQQISTTAKTGMFYISMTKL